MRQRCLGDLGSELFQQRDGAPCRCLYRRLHAIHEVLPGDADSEARQVLPERLCVVRYLNVEGCRVHGVVPGDGVEDVGAVGHVPGDRADLVERACERDEAVPGHQPIGRLEPDYSAERRGLPDAAAGVRAERVVALPCRNRRSRAAAAAAWHAVEVPRVASRKERRVLGGRPHSELVQVALAHEHRGLLVKSPGHGRVVGRDESLEHPRGARCGDACGRHVVLELHWDSGQRRGIARRDAPVGLFSLLQREVFCDGHERLDPVLDLRDTVEGSPREIH